MSLTKLAEFSTEHSRSCDRCRRYNRPIWIKVLDNLRGNPTGETRLDRLASWCLLITIWYPIFAILFSFQDDIKYSFFISYRQVLFPALLIQVASRLAQPVDLGLWKTVALVALAVLHNPIWMIHFGIAWPWRFVDATTIIVSALSVVEVHDARRARELEAA